MPRLFLGERWKVFLGALGGGGGSNEKAKSPQTFLFERKLSAPFFKI